MKKFEYKIVTNKEKGIFLAKLDVRELEEDINALGELGWELTAAFAMDIDNNGKKEAVMVFKREIEKV